MCGDLDGKVAIVTGGTKGIGRAIGLALVDAGAAVVAAGRDRRAGRRLEDEVGERLRYVPTDVAAEESCRELVAQTVAWAGRLDVLVNNAGIIAAGTIEETSMDTWCRIMDVNMRGAFLCTRTALPHIRAAGGGSIINIASINAYWAEPRLVAYCASKAGLVGLTRAVAIDHGKDRVRCNCVCPGYIETDMLHAYYADLPDPEAARHRYEVMHPLGRIGTPEDVAALAVWLASDRAAFVTGQCFVLDGGLTIGSTGGSQQGAP